ncbi:type II toxin-antitoxin system RelE/ParE family toxin [Algiphilus sp.]|uniref:type II toxin-antitoxin system RelE/ParE family toxin n=1 Tax=Algiphilus sp. TaxID=1872431 RepID=UPI0032EEA6D9
MIKSFRCKDTEAFFTTGRCAKFANVKKVAERKLTQLDNAVILDDLKVPPGNRLEPLAGDRAGQHSIRINDQFRVCFVWTEEGPTEVEIVDYH